MSAPVLPERGALARYSPASIPDPYLAPMSPPPGEEESLKGILRVLRKRKYFVGLCALGGVVLAILLCVLMTPQYKGTATIEVGKDAGTEANLLHDAVASGGGADELKVDLTTHMEVLQSDTIALAVIRDLHLQDHRPFAWKPGLMGFFNGENARIRAEQGLPLDQAPATRERLLTIFAKKLKVKNTPDTRLLTVSFMNPDPQLAANVANDVVSQYIYYESRSQTTGPASKWLSAQLDALKQKFLASQEQLADFERKNGLTNVLLSTTGQGGGSGGSTHIPVLDKLDALNQQLTAAESNRLAKEAIYRLTQTQNPEVVVGLGSSSLPGLAASAVVSQGSGLEALQSLRQQQSVLNLQYADLATKDGAKNPHVLEVKNQQAALQQQIGEELQRINARAKNDYLLARQNETDLKQAFAQQQEDASRLNDSAVRLQVLTEEAVSSRQLYEGLYGKLQEANVQAGIHAASIGIADPARTSSERYPPPPITVAIGLAAGLLFGVSSAFIREHLDDTVQTPLQVGPMVQLPVLASIPTYVEMGAEPSARLTPTASRSGEASLLVTQPGSSAAEAYRALRTSILLSSPGAPLHTVLVSSPLVGEGKTTVAYNTAIAFAHVGRRVLLLDSDMRHPRLHDLFGVAKSPGLSEVLSSGQPLEAVIRPHASVQNLSLLPAGSKPGMPAELLGSARFDTLLQTLKGKYDLIIIDSAPMLLVSDATTLAGRVDATLCVIRAGVTTRTAVERVSQMLERSGSYATGLVLNGVNTNSVDFYHAYGYKGGAKYYEETYA